MTPHRCRRDVVSHARNGHNGGLSVTRADPSRSPGGQSHGVTYRCTFGSVADTKQTKTIGEHLVAAELARHGWAPALTRDGLERTDILAVHTGEDRRMVEVQVKTARTVTWQRTNWPLGEKNQKPSAHEREYYVFVAVPHDLDVAPRMFVLPRAHVAAAAWIAHMDWLTEEGIAPGKRTAGVNMARVYLHVFERYENRWDLLFSDEGDAEVLLPPKYRELAAGERVGLPAGHRWRDGNLPAWS